MIGRTLGHYRIEDQLGAGGMGVVYRATDSKLGRPVAIKVLPDSFAHHPERLLRFEREARLLAALNHPHIAAIYGFEESAGVLYLVLEYVPGQTLAQRLAASALTIEEALDVCRQIAEALESAHEKSIIHRDLKPANVKITPGGKVKVLDFGLAKALAPSGGGDSSQSPTVTAETEAGIVLGTAAYMSPEQARGQTVDKRTDIWAFGCVLYEALTRRRAFAGQTMSESMAAVLTAEPDFDALPAKAPYSVRCLLRRCLQKDPQRRLRDIGDARLELEAPAAPPLPAAPSAKFRRAPWSFAGAAFLLGALAMLPLSRFFRGAPAAQRTIRFSAPFAEGEMIYPTRTPQLAISPDGYHFAYQAVQPNGQSQIYLRAVGQLEAKAIPGAIGSGPFFSPDSQWLAFFHGPTQSFRKIALSGGAPVTIAGGSGMSGASWGEDGNIVVGGFDLLTVPASGGVLKTLLPLDLKAGERCYRTPQYLPGGKAVLFTVGRENTDTFDDAQIAVLSLATRRKKILIEGGMCARYSPTGHLVYGRGGGLLAVPFDLKTLTVTGRPFPVLEGVFMSVLGGMAAFSLASTGDLVYAPGIAEGGERVPLLVDRTGAAKPLPVPMRSYVHPRLSTDDTRLVVEVEGPRHDIFAYDFPRGVFTRLSLDGNSHLPILTPDGSRVTFRSDQMDLWWAPVDRGGEGEKLAPSPGSNQSPESWSPDGRVLAFTQSNDQTGADVFVVSLDGPRRPRPLVQTKFNEGSPKFSPDGKWVAYCSNESGRAEIYVTPYPGPGAKIQVSAEGGTDPVWRRGEMFFRNGDKMMAVSVATEPRLTLSKPRRLWEGRYLHGVSSSCGAAGVTSSNYDVSSDGGHFIMIDDKKRDVVARQIHVILGWADELKRMRP